MEETKPLVWVRKSWAELKKIGITKKYVRMTSGEHPGSIQGNKILQLHQLKYSVKIGRIPTNHERVMMLRASKMHISLAEYKRKFCM